MIPSQKTTRASARWRISGPCLAFIALAVVAPAIWSFIGIGNNTGDPFHYGMDEGIFSAKYLWDWLLIPAFYLLLGSLPLGAGAVLLWRRVSDGAFGTIGLSLGLTLFSSWYGPSFPFQAPHATVSVSAPLRPGGCRTKLRWWPWWLRLSPSRFGSIWAFTRLSEGCVPCAASTHPGNDAAWWARQCRCWRMWCGELWNVRTASMPAAPQTDSSLAILGSPCWAARGEARHVLVVG